MEHGKIQNIIYHFNAIEGAQKITRYVIRHHYIGYVIHFPISSGDRILKVNGVSVFTKSLEDVVMMMKKRCVASFRLYCTINWALDHVHDV